MDNIQIVIESEMEFRMLSQIDLLLYPDEYSEMRLLYGGRITSPAINHHQSISPKGHIIPWSSDEEMSSPLHQSIDCSEA